MVLKESGRTVAPTAAVLWLGGPDQSSNFQNILVRKYLTLGEGILGRASLWMRKKAMSSMNQGWILGERVHGRSLHLMGKKA